MATEATAETKTRTQQGTVLINGFMDIILGTDRVDRRMTVLTVKDGRLHSEPAKEALER